MLTGLPRRCVNRSGAATRHVSGDVNDSWIFEAPTAFCVSVPGQVAEGAVTDAHCVHSDSSANIGDVIMKTICKAGMAAVAATFAFSAVPAMAKVSLMVKEDQAQMKMDEAALRREKNQLETDQATLKADKAAGKMAAESKDSERVYKDKLGIQGEKKDLAADKPDSPQWKSDKAALQREGGKLKTDVVILKADKAEGKMAAESKDAERVYRDRQAIRGWKKDIAMDQGNLKAAESR